MLNTDENYTINIVEVKRDREWFARELPKMKEFWDNIKLYREIGIESHPKYSSYKRRSETLSETKKKKCMVINEPVKKNVSYFINES